MACHVWHAIDIFSPQRMSYIRNIKNAVALGDVAQGHGKCFSATGGQCLAARCARRRSTTAFAPCLRSVPAALWTAVLSVTAGAS